MFALYFKLLHHLSNISAFLNPYARRLIRFIALPYCYFYMIDWNQCTASRWQVINDFFYIFFILRYFPDNYAQCRLWEKTRDEWAFYYGSIYDSYQRAAFEKEVVKVNYRNIFSDKEIVGQLCKSEDIPHPICLCCLDIYDNSIEIISEKLKENPETRLILKPVNGSGGKGIKLIYIQDEQFMVRDGTRTFKLQDLQISRRHVLQAWVMQHKDLDHIYPDSLNSMRIHTMLTRNNGVIFIGGNYRFGVNSAYIDNLSSGGIGVPVDTDSGILGAIGHDYQCQTYLAHPNSGTVFEGYQIPFWNEVREVSVRTQRSFPFVRHYGLDVAITPTGPIIIEINALPDMVGFEQINGPIFNNPEVWEAVKDYDLLINLPSKRIYD